ncbi:MAG TPA: chemotaxis protein CheW [Geothrix sp.]|nr:chemotaxis protein CheW [Geothrix sp.]
MKAAGMDLLLPTQDLREVVVASSVAPLPGRPRAIEGVVVYQGEFLPVLAWKELPGCEGVKVGPSVAMAVLRPRLGLPVERLIGTMGLPPGAMKEADESDPAIGWIAGVCELGGLSFRVLDADRLVALLRRFRGDR